MSAFSFEVQKLELPDTYVCKVSGSIDINTSSELEQVGIKLIQSGREKLIFDFSQLDYINSQGLGALLSLHKSLDRTQGAVIIVGMNDRVRKVFEITGMDLAINFYANVNEALKKDKTFLRN